MYARSPYRIACLPACNVHIVRWWVFFLLLFTVILMLNAAIQSKCDVLRCVLHAMSLCLCGQSVLRLLIRLIFCSQARFSIRFERATNSSTHMISWTKCKNTTKAHFSQVQIKVLKSVWIQFKATYFFFSKRRNLNKFQRKITKKVNKIDLWITVKTLDTLIKRKQKQKQKHTQQNVCRF